jgi:SWI/SNF-related matrix-associated actin-dependent regulator 1 of chromatin subfamily A
MSTTSESAANKRPFSDLKFTKNKKQRTSSPAVEASSSSSSLDVPPYGEVPTQSRDASMSSRYFTTTPLTPSSQGKVLVPESSPLESNSSYRPYQPYSFNSGPGSSSAVTVFNHNNAWGPSRPPSDSDVKPSSSSSENAFIARLNASTLSNGEPSHRPNSISRLGRLTELNGAAGSPDQLDLLSSPASPALIKPGQKRPGRRKGPIMSSEEEDDELPSVSVMNPTNGASSSSDAPSKPRIVRGGTTLPPSSSPPPNPSSSTGSTSSSAPGATTNNAPSSSTTDAPCDPAYTLFAFEYPSAPPERKIWAWNRANGVTKVAHQYMSMPYDKPPLLKPADGVGRVTQRDEEAKARRQADRDRAAKSAIYGARESLGKKPLSTPTRAFSPANSTASSSKAPTSRARSPTASGSVAKKRILSPASSKADVLDLTVSPASPVVQAPRRKRIRRLVASSDEDEVEVVSQEDSDDDEEPVRRSKPTPNQASVLDFFNQKSSEAVQELTGCTPAQADAIIGLRPFDDVDDFNEKLFQGKKKPGPGGIRNNLFSDCESIFAGYSAVDGVLQNCEDIAVDLKAAIASWGFTTSPANGHSAASSSLSAKQKGKTVESSDGMLNLHMVDMKLTQKRKDFLSIQPALLADGVNLKDYQLLGVNWLNLLYQRKLSCILADEMGLGKTVQVISFFAHLRAQYKSKGPHLVVVPSSTLENWIREFDRFAPSIKVRAYYEAKGKRSELRDDLINSQRCNSHDGTGWEVLVTTYNLAQGDEYDRKFFKKIKWNACVFDEGHVLKNFESQRYQALLKYPSRWRLLLTGTPLQNNLQELVSLMNFILPDKFADSLEQLRAIFKVKGDSKVSLLAQERVSRAKKMMTPFVLRRRKDQVLKDLPKKTVRVEWCEMTPLQAKIYRDTLQRSRKMVLELAPSAGTSGASTPVTKSKKVAKPKPTQAKKYLENSTNVLMDLRKAASHPMLFRTRFSDSILTNMTNQLLKEPDFKKRKAEFQYVKEDMEVMTDSELQYFCGTYKSIQKFKQDETCYVDAGKVKTLLRLLDEYIKEGRKVLIFSQFTQILDILQVVLNQRSMKFLLLTGSTAVDTRQSLVDEFTEDQSIPVFLLSTKAGGLGITLTAASVVIMFDQDFNPHNDKQAQDRAYRIGQKRDVDVIKLISKGTIEEDMMRLGETKLALDEAVAGEGNGAGDEETEKEVKISLLTTLRRQFEAQEQRDGKD